MSWAIRLRLLTVLAIVALYAQTASATVVTTADGSSSYKFQTWVDRAYIPGPTSVVVRLLRCPAADKSACVYPNTIEIYLDPASITRRKFLHEVGHVFDYGQPQWARDKFEEIMHDTRPWRSPPNSPHEQFAEAWAGCASHKAISDEAAFGYNYLPTPRQFQKACQLIKSEIN
jgi:hypothetical protein